MANFNISRKGKCEEVKVSSALIKAVTGRRIYTCVSTNFPMHLCRSVHGTGFVTIGSYWGIDSQAMDGQHVVRMYEYDASGVCRKDRWMEMDAKQVPRFFEEGFYSYQEAFLIANMPRLISKLYDGSDDTRYYMYYPDPNNTRASFGYYSERELFSDHRYSYLFFRDRYYKLNFRERILEQVPEREVLNDTGIFDWKEYPSLQRCHDFMKKRNTQILLLPGLGNLPGAPYYLSPDLIENGIDFSGSRVGKLVQYGFLKGVEVPLNRFGEGEDPGAERKIILQTQIRIFHPKEFGPQFYEMEKENDQLQPFLDSISYKNHLKNYRKYGFRTPYDSFMILDNLNINQEWRRHGLGTTILSVLKELMTAACRMDIPVLLASPKFIRDSFMLNTDFLPYDQRLDFLANAGGKLLTGSGNETPVFSF